MTGEPSGLRALIADMRQDASQGTLGDHSARMLLKEYANRIEAALAAAERPPFERVSGSGHVSYLVRCRTCGATYEAGTRDDGTPAPSIAEQVAAERPTPEQGWQPIETAPKDGTEVLLTDGHYKRVGNWARLRNCWCIDTAVSLKQPTHWAPIPQEVRS